MEMLRWLATNKVVQTTWGLGILTMVMSSVFGGGNSDAKHEPAKAEAVAVEQVAEVKAVPEVATEASVPVVQALVATEVAATEEVAKADVVEVVEVVETEVVEAAAESSEAAATEVAEAVVETTEEAAEVSTETAEVVAETEAAAEVIAEATEAAVEAVEAEVVAEAAVEPAEAEVVTEEVATEAEVAAATEEVATAAVAEEVSTEAEVASEADADGFADKSAADLLVMAREAYWNNGLEESAEIYKALIEREPTVIEHKGELGNVFWRQGYPKQAAELYAEIAAPMIEKGNGERVSNMVGFIGLFFPEKATEIRALLDAQ
jgi:hypothetical protein